MYHKNYNIFKNNEDKIIHFLFNFTKNMDFIQLKLYNSANEIEVQIHTERS